MSMPDEQVSITIMRGSRRQSPAELNVIGPVLTRRVYRFPLAGSCSRLTALVT